MTPLIVHDVLNHVPNSTLVKAIWKEGNTWRAATVLAHRVKNPEQLWEYSETIYVTKKDAIAAAHETSPVVFDVGELPPVRKYDSPRPQKAFPYSKVEKILSDTLNVNGSINPWYELLHTASERIATLLREEWK